MSQWSKQHPTNSMGADSKRANVEVESVVEVLFLYMRCLLLGLNMSHRSTDRI